MTTLSEQVELNIEQLANKLDADMPYTVISGIEHYKSVYNCVKNNKNYKLLIFISNDTLKKEHLSDTFNTLVVLANDKESALSYAEDAQKLSTRIYVVR
jgi:hypothetical protein